MLPRGDNVASNIQATFEHGTTNNVQVGVGPNFAGGVAPSLVVHAQHADRLTYERSMESWRGGLVFERCKLPPDHSLTLTGVVPPLTQATSDPPSAALTPERGRSGFFSRWTPSAADESPPPLFRVLSRHPERCYCRVPRAGDDRCRHRSSRRHAYDRCASWTGQTQAQLHMWTPEIYQNRNCVHTITREVDAAAVDALLARRTMRGLAELRRLLHFDLDVEVRLREIGWGLWGRLRPVSKPAEIRAKDDAGRPLPADRARICITCCPESINWPERETRDLQAEVEDQVRSRRVG